MPAEWSLPVTSESGVFVLNGAATLVCVDLGENAPIIENILRFQRDDLLKILFPVHKQPSKCEEAHIIVPARKRLIRKLNDQEIRNISGYSRYEKSKFIELIYKTVSREHSVNENTLVYLTDIRRKIPSRINNL